MNIDTSHNPEWDSKQENGSSDLDPLAILIAAEDNDDNDDTLPEGTMMDDSTNNTSNIDNTILGASANPFADANDKASFDNASASVDYAELIKAQELEVKSIETDLLKTRADGKEQWVISKSASANYRARKSAEVRVIELQVDMKNLAVLLSAGNEKLRQLHIARMLLNVAKLELPTDDNPIGQRAAATFLCGGINGVRTSMHYLDNRKPKLEELIERDRKRGNVAGKVYRDYADDMEELNALAEQLDIILQWAMPVCDEALLTMKTNEFYNPSLRNPAERYGTPTDNATPFD